jgi:hypothetical protein
MQMTCLLPYGDSATTSILKGIITSVSDQPASQPKHPASIRLVWVSTEHEKTKEFDNFDRDWPNIIVADDETIKKVDKKWSELGIGRLYTVPFT